MLTKGINYMLFMMVLTTLFASLLEKNFSLLPDRTLKGSFDTAMQPDFTLEDWLSGDFQSNYESFLKDNLGGRPYLVRTRNQYYYTVFNKAMANSVVPAKDGVLLDHDYVAAFYGDDFKGEEFLTERLIKWKKVQRGLDSIGVKAFLAMAPGKGSFFEDQITDELLSTHKPNTNYGFIVNWAEQNDLRVLDLKKIYHTWVDTSRYPLFPKGGIHWSEYGVALVIDTLRGYIQTITERPLQKFWFDVRIADEPEGTDNDIGEGMNLLFTPKEKGLAYPFRYFGEDSTVTPTRLLTIADSYYFNIFYSGFADRICSHGGF